VLEMVRGGVSVPWNIAASMLIGVWLLFTRITLGTEGAMANADHLIGSLVLTVCAIACAEVARPVRFLNLAFALALLATPFVYDASDPQTLASMLCGVLLGALSLRPGPVRGRYAAWNARLI
jgi:hypothetical protein